MKRKREYPIWIAVISSITAIISKNFIIKAIAIISLGIGCYMWGKEK